MASILVTGATGFIGARIVDALLVSGGHALSFTGRRRPRDTSLEERGARFLQGDLLDLDFCERAISGVDAVIHCAGLAGTSGQYDKYFQANVVGTENLLSAAQKNRCERFVNISSPSIYFEFKDQLDLREDYRPKKFSNAYAETKWLAEQLVQNSNSPNFHTVSLRPRSVIGAGDRNVLPRLIRLQETGSLVQIGPGKNVVDITTIGNLIHAVELCLVAPAEAMGEVYNISNGQPMEFWRFVEMVLTRAGLPTDRKRLPYWPVMGAAKLNEFIHRVIPSDKEPALLPIAVGILSFSMTMNIEKARRKLGYQPRYSTEDGVNEFFTSFHR